MRAVLSVVLVAVGVLIVVVGVLYLTQPAHALPTFIPGYVAHATGKHPRRGIVALVVGGLLVLGGILLGVVGRRRYRW
jgi:hypothetical protein